EPEPVLGRHLQHPQVNHRVFVPGEADEPRLARLLGRQYRLLRPARREDAVRVFQADDFVVLEQVQVVGLESLERLVDLLGRLLLRPAVDLGHQEHFVAVAVLERLTHPLLAGALVVIPRVVHERDAGVDGRADDRDALLLGLLRADVEPADADGRHLDASAAERAVAHAVADGFLRRAEGDLAGRLRVDALAERWGRGQAGTADGRRLQEVASLHGTVLGRVGIGERAAIGVPAADEVGTADGHRAGGDRHADVPERDRAVHWAVEDPGMTLGRGAEGSPMAESDQSLPAALLRYLADSEIEIASWEPTNQLLTLRVVKEIGPESGLIRFREVSH